MVLQLIISLFFLVALDKIPYVDFPELKLSKHESTEMPFRYVIGEDGQPIMPEVHIISSVQR